MKVSPWAEQKSICKDTVLGRGDLEVRIGSFSSFSLCFEADFLDEKGTQSNRTTVPYFCAGNQHERPFLIGWLMSSSLKYSWKIV